MLSKSKCMLFLGAAAFAVTASASAQQGSPRGAVSSTRIPVSKEQPPPPQPVPTYAPPPAPTPPPPPACVGTTSVMLTGVDMGTVRSFSDNNIIAHLLNTDTLEIELALAAMARAQNPDVRRFAGTLLTDHKNDMPRIRHVESDKKIPAQVNPADMSAQNLAQALTDLRGPMPMNCTGYDQKFWDQKFVAEQLQYHYKALQALRTWEKSARAEDLRDRLEILVPIEQRHYDEAQRLANQLGISVQGGG